MHVDTLWTNDAIESVNNNMHCNNIDIACVQETPINSNDHLAKWIRNMFGGEPEIDENNKNKVIKAGVAIAINATWATNILQINRYQIRPIEIRINTDNIL